MDTINTSKPWKHRYSQLSPYSWVLAWVTKGRQKPSVPLASACPFYWPSLSPTYPKGAELLRATCYPQGDGTSDICNMQDMEENLLRHLEPRLGKRKEVASSDHVRTVPCSGKCIQNSQSMLSPFSSSSACLPQWETLALGFMKFYKSKGRANVLWHSLLNIPPLPTMFLGTRIWQIPILKTGSKPG